MKLRFLLTGFLALLIILPGFSQSWTSLKKKGDEYAELGAYWEAAEYYYQAWKDKPNKLELAFKAGTYYGLVKDYAHAAECLEVVSHWNEPDKLCGLNYARALKQSGQYEKAIPAFETFIANYSGEDKADLQTVVNREIAGCQEANNESGVATPWQVLHAGTTMNSKATDFAPAPFGKDVVYFSSTRDGKSKLFRSIQTNGKWGKADVPAGLPSSPDKHIANGSFTPDGNRFYYTVCAQNTDGNKLHTRCELYVMTKSGSSWSSGKRLPDYINLEGVNQTHPTSVVLNNTEYLFFSSDRPGGEGGMDIWYSTRDNNSSQMDYSLPETIGQQVNTMGDELAPFYDLTHGKLYFSSNGHVSMGGQDIYILDGTPTSWGAISHPGTPLNSPADDLYFRLNAEGDAGFISSNRLSPGNKIHTRDEDLFSISSNSIDHIVRGQLYDKMSRMPLTEGRVNIYHITNGEKVMFNSTYAANGQYEFVVPNGLEAYVLAEKFEYEPSSYKINYQEAKGNTITHDFFLVTETMPDERPLAQANTGKDVVRPEEVIDETIATSEAKPAPQPKAPSKEIASPKKETAVADKNMALETPKPSTPPEKEIAIKEPTKKEDKVSSPPPPAVTPKVSQQLEPSSAVEEHDIVEIAEPKTELSGEIEDMIVETVDELPATEPVVAIAPSKKSSQSPSKTSLEAPPMFAPSDETISASTELFTGSGVDKRYNGKRVDKRKYESETRPYAGIYYRIQLEATDQPDLSSSRYASMTSYGTLETEKLAGMGLSRILVGVIQTQSGALDALRSAHDTGFVEAYIVRYEDGVRLRRWK